jgi:iron complex outermembrane receptor protein
LGYKTNLADDVTLRLNVASGFRAPNLAELTSNGVHEGTNRYEIGNSNLKQSKCQKTDLKNTKWIMLSFCQRILQSHQQLHLHSPTGDNRRKCRFDYIQDNAKLWRRNRLHFHPHPLDWLHLKRVLKP